MTLVVFGLMNLEELEEKMGGVTKILVQNLAQI